MKIYHIPLFFLFFLSHFYSAQESNLVISKTLNQYPQNEIQTDEFGYRFYYDKRQKAKIYEINGETVVVMDELVLSSKNKFNNELDRKYYQFLNKKLNRVYPLFLTALYQYREIQVEMKNMDSSARRKYVRDRQDILASQYEKQLRDLTTTEGQVFAKLMNRATGKNVYEIIKELRGGWSAFWWNVKGKLADIELKERYSPKTNRTDLYIESLLQNNWKKGYLRPYMGAEEFSE